MNKPVVNFYININQAYTTFTQAVMDKFFINEPNSYDFEFCKVDSTNPNDAYGYFLSEHNIKAAELPVLCINNTIYKTYYDAVRAGVLA